MGGRETIIYMKWVKLVNYCDKLLKKVGEFDSRPKENRNSSTINYSCGNTHLTHPSPSNVMMKLQIDNYIYIYIYIYIVALDSVFPPAKLYLSSKFPKMSSSFKNEKKLLREKSSFITFHSCNYTHIDGRSRDKL